MSTDPKWIDDWNVERRTGATPAMAARAPNDRSITRPDPERRYRPEEMQDQLKAVEDPFKIMVDVAPGIMWLARADGYVTYINPYWESYTGLSAAQAEGHGWVQTLHPEDRGRVMAAWAMAVRDGKNFELEARLRAADGSYRHFLWQVTPVRTPAGTVPHWTGTAVDTEALKLAQTALRRAEGLAVVGRLAASIVHEINNPLAALANLLYLIGRSDSDEARKRYLDMAEEELGRVSTIATQTLRFHRQTTSPVSTTLAAIFDSVLALFQNRLRQTGVKVERRHGEKDVLGCMDGEIRQVFANLVGNALDAMPEGGRLVVRSRLARHPVTGAAGVRVSVGDTGWGMSEETRRRLFEPFYTTKGENGTGLGLWVSEEILRRHGASVRVRSRSGRDRHGTLFSMFFPRKELNESYERRGQ